MKYRSEIDGLRALAVVPVVLFHAGVQAFGGGFVGVDIFFVISGYLITTILMGDLAAGSFSIVRFYERRARRILPMLFCVMLASVPFAWIVLSPSQLTSFSRSLVAVVLFVSNFFFWRDGGYFESAAELKPLLHTWSLAVEEQYYIFFPIFLWLVWRFGRRYLFWILASIAVISLIIAQIGSVHRPVPTFFLLPSRAWELAIGALAAVYLAERGRLERIGRTLCEGLSMSGLLLVLVSIFSFSKNLPFPSLYALFPTVGAVLIILFAEQGTLVGRLLSSRICVWIGLGSYSAYLWHQPVLAFARVGGPSLGRIPLPILLLLIAVLSVLSWRYVEQPFRRGDRFSRRSIFVWAGCLSAVLVVFGLCSAGTDFGREVEVAQVLSRNVAVYAADMDERLFTKSRIKCETMTPQTVVLGSSRLMQVSTHSPGIAHELLNLTVSGSSVEDDLAIWRLASAKFNPSLILIGADPWLFNVRSGQQRWQTLASDYAAAVSDLEHRQMTARTATPTKQHSNSWLQAIYRSVNVWQIAAADDTPEIIDKIRRDGSRVYNTVAANKPQHEVLSGLREGLVYAMSPYERSDTTARLFERWIRSIKTKHKIILVLSPYHPKLYQIMETSDRKFLEIEQQFRDLSNRLGIQIIGSYDPNRVGCNSSEFYDGMHPRSSCMDKVLAQIQ